jgi:Ca-activated chloride channel family protein
MLRSIPGPGARATLIVALLLANPAAAQDRVRILPVVPPPPPSFVYLSPHAVRATATLRDGMARVTVEQDYVNPSPRPLEGMVCFPLARDASVSDFSMYVDGRRLEGVLLDADEARRTYEEIVRQRRDPALLELVGRGMLRARLFPIPPGGTRTLRIEYGQVLRGAGARTEFALPFATGEGARPVPFHATVTIVSRGRLGPVYSPTHALECGERSDRRAVVTARGEALPGRDLTLLYAEDRRDLGTQVLTARRGGGGYFLLFALPWQERATRAASDVVFVLDTSGSMGGPKMEQARNSLRYCLDRLDPGDRFGIVAFSDRVTAFSDRLTPADRRARRDAAEFVDGLDSGGGTDIASALAAAFRMARDSRGAMVVFLTDGLPTVGVTSLEEIETRARSARPEGAHLFTFGVGYDVNAPFLDRLAREGRGASDYVKPEEDIEVRVGALFEKVSSPVLRDVTVSVEGARAFDVYPRSVPDLFRGEQLVVLGRYDGAKRGGSAVIVRGTDPDGRRVVVRAPFDASPRAGAHGYVPTLWASRKIAYLADQARLEGETPQLRETIVGLSREYGILTEYTSYYVGENEPAVAQRPAGKGGSRGGFNPLGALMPMAPPPAGDAGARAQRKTALESAPQTGQAAIEQSLRSSEMKSSASLDAADRAASKEEAANGAIRSCAGRLFENRAGVWTDTNHSSRQRVLRIEPWSEAYLELLRRLPSLAQAAGLGDHVLIAGRGLTVELIAGGKRTLDAREWSEVERAFR